MIILQVLFVFAFFFSSSTIFSAEPLEASACAVPQHDALTKLSPQFKEDLREVKALCNMRASLNNILFIAHAGNAGYQAHIKTDLAIYEKATKILKFINFDSAGPLNTNELKLNQGWIDKLYRHISMQAQSRTDQERMERLVYNTKRKKGRNNPMRSSEEILLELPVFTQIKEILGRYASRHEIEITRLLVTNVDFTVVSIDGNKVMTELPHYPTVLKF